jgi:hypothetical protein
MARRMLPRSPLDNPETAAFAWARYKRLMRFMVAVTVSVVLVAFAVLYHFNGMVSIHLYIATALGVGVSMLLMSALMGLVFLSSGTGHDETLIARDDDKDNRRPQD